MVNFRSATTGHDLTDPGRDLKGALKKPQCKHFAAITKPQELARLPGTIEACQGTYVVRAALKLSPMLLVRPGELRKARWCEFDLDNGLWYAPSARQQVTTGSFWKFNFETLGATQVSFLAGIFVHVADIA